MSVSCPACKKENRDHAKFCVHCGENFASYHPCPTCHVLSKSSKFCTACGQKMEAPAHEPLPIDVVTTVPLATTMPEPVPVPAPEPAREPAAEPVPEPVSVAAPKTASVLPSGTPFNTVETVVVSPTTASKPSPLLVIGGVLIASLLAGGGYWFASKGEAAEAKLFAATSTPVPAVQVEPVATPQLAASDVSREEPVPVPVDVPAPVVAPTPSPVVKPTKETRPAKLVDEKKKTPESSAREYRPVTPKLPDVEAPTVKVETPPLPKPAARTVDDQFNDRLAGECAKGLSGLFCREKVRFSVCDGKWSENPPPGQSVCKGTANK